MKRVTIALSVVLLLVSIVSTVFADVPAPAPVVEEKTKDQVMAMLSGIEYFPPPEQWQSLSDDAIKVLKWVATDSTQWPIRRARAVLAIGYIKTDDSRDFLAQILTLNDRIAPMLKRHAMASLAKGWGEQVIDLIKPYLDDSDYFVREAAVSSLGTIGTPRALELIRARQQIEPEATLRKTIQQTLKKAGQN